MSIDILLRYFPSLTDIQKSKFLQMESLYNDWNKKINVISRQDIDKFFERHILHSLSIVKYFQFEENNSILDVGTGGGFPGIPLAVLYNRCHFTLIDSIRKKINIVNEIIKELDLNNVEALCIRSENFQGCFDYIVSRAVTNLPAFVNQTKHLVRKGKGIIYLKGGEFEEELQKIHKQVQIFDISKVLTEPFFETKKIVWIQV